MWGNSISFYLKGNSIYMVLSPNSQGNSGEKFKNLEMGFYLFPLSSFLI